MNQDFHNSYRCFALCINDVRERILQSASKAEIYDVRKRRIRVSPVVTQDSTRCIRVSPVVTQDSTWCIRVSPVVTQDSTWCIRVSPVVTQDST